MASSHAITHKQIPQRKTRTPSMQTNENIWRRIFVEFANTHTIVKKGAMIYHFTALNMANLVLSINICQEYQYWFVASFLYISCHIKNRQQRNKGIVYANISTKDTSKPTIFQYINIQFINMLSYRNRSVFICQHTSQRLVAHVYTSLYNTCKWITYICWYSTLRFGRTNNHIASKILHRLENMPAFI